MGRLGLLGAIRDVPSALGQSLVCVGRPRSSSGFLLFAFLCFLCWLVLFVCLVGGRWLFLCLGAWVGVGAGLGALFVCVCVGGRALGRLLYSSPLRFGHCLRRLAKPELSQDVLSFE